jgi:hypothetical protein
MTFTPIPKGTPDWDVPVNAAFTELDSRVTVNEGAIANYGPRITTLESDTVFKASDYGLASMAYDPTIATNQSALISGSVFMTKLMIRSNVTVNRLWYNVSVAGTSLTAGQNFIGLYDSSGNRIAVSADLSSDWTATGLKSTSFTAPVDLIPGAYYGAILCNATTPITVARGSGQSTNMMNVNLTSSTARFTQGGTGWASVTSLPASGTLGNRSLSGIPIWMALN